MNKYTFSIKLCLCALLMLSACSQTPVKNPLAQWAGSPNYDVRKPRLIVIHHTEMLNVESALKVLQTRNDNGQVSAHYLIADNGKIFQLVDDKNRAWHAGAGSWQGITDINSISIGIELDNDGVEPFDEAQIQALIKLLDDLCTRLKISRTAIIGHADLAPTRKTDPNRLFPWQRLAKAGFGVWYDEQLEEPPAGFDPITALRSLGYDTKDLPAAVRAFHRHFRGIETDTLDDQDSRILFSLQKNNMNH
jgi:N-acetylmuramoyl-L-alanine amidase